MPRLPIRLAVLLTMIVSVLGVASAGAQSPADPEIRIDAPEGATDIVQGEIADESWVDTDSGLVTDWTVHVSDVIVGDALDTIVVRTEGGTDPQGYVHKVSGQPELAVGDRVQLWLRPGDDGRYRPVGGTAAAAAISEAGQLLPESRDAADNFVLEGYFWADSDMPIGYRINPNTPDLTDESAEIQAAFQTWEDDPLSDVDFDFDGTTSIAERTFDGTNAVFWADTNEGYLARTTSIFNGVTGEMVEFDIQYNPDWQWVAGKAEGKFDVLTVGIHEAGHALGLGHPSGSGAIMFATLASNKVKRNLSNGDKGGVRALYGLPACEGQLATIAGTDGNDNLTGTPGDDIIAAGDGNDTVDGGGGNDLICGGEGDDDLSGGGGNDIVNGDAGADNLGGGGGNDTVRGNGGNDVLRGGGGNDDLWGLGGNDIVQGDDGNDTARGGNGDDTVRGDAGDDKLTGSTGDDTLEGGEGADRLFGHEGDDVLGGGGGADRLFGNEDDDVLRGNGGSDTLKGHDGSDDLFGGGGGDVLRGGDDSDRLVGSAGNDDLAGGGAADDLDGDEGSDELNGNAGHDNLSGGTGNDALSGGIGNDALFGNGGNDSLDGNEHTDACNGGGGTDTGARCESSSNIP